MGNIGKLRHFYEPETGKAKLFVAGYTNAETPNLWDRSKEVLAAAG